MNVSSISTCLSCLLLMTGIDRGHGDSSIILYLAEGFQNNQQSIATWRGAAQINDVQVGYATKDFPIQESHHRVKFVSDVSRDAVRWNWVVQGILSRSSLNSNPVEASMEVVEHHGMVREDALYQLYASPRQIQNEGHKPAVVGHNTIGIYPRSNNTGAQLTYAFNPAWYLTSFNHPDLPQYLKLLATLAQTPDKTGVSVKIEANLIIIQSKSLGVINELTFDVKQGGMLVKYFGEDTAVTETYNITYTQVDGVWIPEIYKYHNVRRIGGKEQIWQREVTFSDQVINGLVSDDDFSLEAIGARLGDEITDTRHGLAYKYGPNTDDISSVLASWDKLTLPTHQPVSLVLQPDQTIDAAELPLQQPGKNSAWFVTSGFLFLFIVGIGLVLFRRQKSST